MVIQLTTAAEQEAALARDLPLLLISQEALCSLMMSRNWLLLLKSISDEKGRELELQAGYKWL